MRRSSTVIRALVTVVALVLSVLTAADSASAQALPPGERYEVTAERSASSIPEKTTGSMEDCRSRRGSRHVTSNYAPFLHLVQVCDCAVRMERKGSAVASWGTGRDAVPRSRRSGELPVLHQVFRC